MKIGYLRISDLSNSLGNYIFVSNKSASSYKEGELLLKNELCY